VFLRRMGSLLQCASKSSLLEPKRAPVASSFGK
jgi:hypothetical protein